MLLGEIRPPLLLQQLLLLVVVLLLPLPVVQKQQGPRPPSLTKGVPQQMMPVEVKVPGRLLQQRREREKMGTRDADGQ